jgi:hypothetical protein
VLCPQILEFKQIAEKLSCALGDNCGIRLGDRLEFLRTRNGSTPQSEEKREPVSDINTVVVDSLKELDPEWPIREAEVARPAAGSSGSRMTRSCHSVIQFVAVHSSEFHSTI